MIPKRLLIAMNIFFRLFVWVMGVIVIYMLILKITSHSPTADQIIIAFLTIIGGLIFGLIGLVFSFNSKLEGKISRLDRRLSRLEGQFHEFAKAFTAMSRDLKRVIGG
jgi:hypothetical protein